MINDSAQYPNRRPISALVLDNARPLPPFAEVFGNGNPVEVEIGCGKAKFLLARASEYPRINFLGIDVVWKWMKFGVRRSERQELSNIRFLKTDAKEAIQQAIAPGSVSIFHVYFPDPWPKRKHRKRRMITGDFLRLLHDRLTDDGFIELATDHADYYSHMEKAVIQSGVPWKQVRKTTDERLFEAQSKTNYEIKYEAAGRKLNYLEMQK